MGKANNEQYEQLILCQIVVDGGKETGCASCVCACVHIYIKNRVVREGFAEKVKCAIAPEKGKGGNHANI